MYISLVQYLYYHEKCDEILTKVPAFCQIRSSCSQVHCDFKHLYWHQTGIIEGESFYNPWRVYEKFIFNYGISYFNGKFSCH